jgi:hypothetical protein
MSDDDSTKPLLTRTVVTSERALVSPTPSFMPSSSPRTHRIWPLLAMLVLVHLSTVLYTLPLNRVIELRLCQEHYELHNPTSTDGTIPEKLCKVDEVQRRLAWLQGIMETTLVICGM